LFYLFLFSLSLQDPFITVTPLDSECLSLVLASDGLWETTTDEEVASVVSQVETAQELADKLLARAVPNTRDNVTVVALLF
jgi:serine/threonine protein phosphatase PrpC